MERTYNYFCLGDDCTGDGKVIAINQEETLKDEPMYCPTCQSQMKRVGEKSFTVMGSKAEQYAKQSAHLKKVSKEHARSDDGKELKRKAIDREMGVQGYENAKKNIKEV